MKTMLGKMYVLVLSAITGIYIVILIFFTKS